MSDKNNNLSPKRKITYSIIAGAFLLTSLFILDTTLAVFLIGLRYFKRTNYLDTIYTTHATRIILTPFLSKDLFKELPKDINYVGNLITENAIKKYHAPSSIYGWRMGKFVAATSNSYVAKNMKSYQNGLQKKYF